MPGPTTVSGRPARIDDHARAFGALPLPLLRAVGRAEVALAAATSVGEASPSLGLEDLRGLRRTVAALVDLDASVAVVAADLRAADGRSARLVRLPAWRLTRQRVERLAGGRAAPLRTQRRAGPDGAGVVVADLSSLGGDRGPVAWAPALAGHVGSGPVHLVVHGWGATDRSAESAGEVTADLADDLGVVGATVIVVDWPAGEGTEGPTSELLGDFRAAQAAVGPAAVQLAGLLRALGALGAPVSIAAHSLGCDLVVRALSQLGPDPGLSVDLLAIQPAVDAGLVGRDPGLGALLGAPIGRLTLTVDERDRSLALYEAAGRPALGDERPGGFVVRDLVAARDRAGAATEVVAHHERVAGGHLRLSPRPGDDLVRTLTAAQLRRSGSVAAPR